MDKSSAGFCHSSTLLRLTVICCSPPLPPFFSALLFAQSTFAALTVDQVVTNIGIVTLVSGEANSALGLIDINTIDPSTIETTGQTLVNSFNTIISDLAADVAAMQATPPIADDDLGTVTQPIVDALTTFVGVHQALLSTVIGKHTIFAQFGVTSPIAAVLRSLEAGIDAFAFAMIDMIPTRKTDVENDQNQLDESVGNTITLYVQLCIPSVLYPTILPICLTL